MSDNTYSARRIDGRWSVVLDGDVVSTHDTREQARAEAKRLAETREIETETVNASEDEILTVEDILNARPEVATTREEWLVRAIEALKTDVFGPVAVSVPDVRVSVGWPGSGSKNTRIGETWAARAATDNKPQIFVSPLLDDAVYVLGVLSHELIHAIDDCEHGHGPAFRQMALAIGLTGKMTATVAGDALRARLEGIAAFLGPFPHSALRPTGSRVTTTPGDPDESEVRTSGPKKQSTRMLKTFCEESGYTARTTRKWLDTYGAPICPCHGAVMTVEA